MKIAVIGGGSLRLLPILRGVMSDSPEIFNHGELRFIDLKQDRAEAVAAMVKATPEFSRVVNCKISCPSTEEGLKDIDILYLTMAARRQPTETMSRILAHEYGYISSDQLTVNGAFLSLRIGNAILNIARKLEKLSPKALMLIFPNPVAVYSCMVNRFTKIKALGICGGFNNHRWDLTRLCFGREESDPNWNVVAAGVNHLSFIIRGDYKGEDLYSSLLPRTLTDSWKIMDIQRTGLSKQILESVLTDLYRLYRKYNTLVFSTEYDGMAHISIKNYQILEENSLEFWKTFDPEKTGREFKERENNRFSEFFELSRNPESIDWSLPISNNPYCGINYNDISIPIFKAVAGIKKMRIVASHPNYGAISGLPEGFAAEYTMDIFKQTITPVENQYIPSPFQGLISSLSEFQTLNAEALATGDPAKFAAAFDAYPVNRFSAKRKDFLKKMFDIYTDIDPVWKKSVEMIY